MKLYFLTVAFGALFAAGLGGCQTVSMYQGPPVDSPHATLVMVKPDSFDFLHDLSTVMVFPNADCTSEGENLGQILTQIHYTSPEPVRLWVHQPVYMRVVTERFGGYRNISCVNIFKMTPKAEKEYAVVQTLYSDACVIEIREVSGLLTLDVVQLPVAETCLLPGYTKVDRF